MNILRNLLQSKKGYGSDQYTSLSTAYSAYQRHRLLGTGRSNAALAPRDKFAVIWGWQKKK